MKRNPCCNNRPYKYVAHAGAPGVGVYYECECRIWY